MGQQSDDDDDTFDTDVDTDDDTDDGGEEDEVDKDELIKRLKAEKKAQEVSMAKMQAGLKRANTQAAKLRMAKKTEESNEGKDTSNADEIERWQRRTVRAAARAGLAEADAKPERLSHLVKLIDMADVEFDDDDNVIGLDEQIEALRKSLPELFRSDDEDEKPTKRRPSGVRLTAGNRKAAGRPAEEIDTTTLQVRALRAGR